MSTRKKAKRRQSKLPPVSASPGHNTVDPLYQEAHRLATTGDYPAARRIFERIEAQAAAPSLQALLRSDLGALAALEGDSATALDRFRAALALDASCAPARHNLDLLQACHTQAAASSVAAPTAQATASACKVKVAIVSFLFNWPSTGGGIVHTVELARFLIEAGYEVQHFYVRFGPWRIGVVAESIPFPSQALAFDESAWMLPQIKSRIAAAVGTFDPDYVILTDSWNIKPHLAAAVEKYPYILRLQAMECLCPLNNVRLLPGPDGEFRQCPTHQLAKPSQCYRCLEEWQPTSGSLHRLERQLSEVGTPAYFECLSRAFANAEAVLVVNPLHEAMLGPYAKSVRVVTAGMDAGRFPTLEADETPVDGKMQLLFAGLVQEPMKGFGVLHDACAKLWHKRQDFELVATGDPPGQIDPFTRFIGWRNQQELPGALQQASVVVIPTVAQEALGRTAVEAMAAGRPVVASRIGGLPFTVTDGATGLLFDTGQSADLAAKIERLLDDAPLRTRLGRAGRQRFEDHYRWEVIIERHYKPLLKQRRHLMTNGFVPHLPERIDRGRLLREAADFFAVPIEHVEARFRIYEAFHEAKDYERNLGERKTLCLEEAFLLSLALSILRPDVVVEIGTGDGRATRRLLDARNALGLSCPVRCYGAAKQIAFLAADEVEIFQGDPSGRFAEEVLSQQDSGLIFVDVHGRAVLREIVSAVLSQRGAWVLALHDCTAGLCNPHMDERVTEVSSSTGVWERHVLAESFGIADPTSAALDQAEVSGHRLRIFTTPHGMAIIRPVALQPAKARQPELTVGQERGLP